MDLHDELLTYAFSSWHSYTILHAMIDSGQITEFICQATDCKMPTREFIKKGPRGSPGLLVIDHIVPRRQNGSHHIRNLRIMHNACNAGWRKGHTGSFHTEETKERLRETSRKAHAEGRMKHIYTPERNKRVSEGIQAWHERRKIKRGEI